MSQTRREKLAWLRKQEASLRKQAKQRFSDVVVDGRVIATAAEQANSISQMQTSVYLALRKLGEEESYSY